MSVCVCGGEGLSGQFKWSRHHFGQYSSEKKKDSLKGPPRESSESKRKEQVACPNLYPEVDKFRWKKSVFHVMLRYHSVLIEHLIFWWSEVFFILKPKTTLRYKPKVVIQEPWLFLKEYQNIAALFEEISSLLLALLLLVQGNIHGTKFEKSLSPSSFCHSDISVLGILSWANTNLLLRG